MLYDHVVFGLKRRYERKEREEKSWYAGLDLVFRIT